MVWPPSAPSQMWMGRGARSQRTCVCCEYARNAGVRPPSDSGPRVAGSGSRVSALCCAGRKKNRQVSGPRVRRAGSGRVGALGLSLLVLFMGRNVVTVLCSKSWSEYYCRSLLACRCLAVSLLQCCKVPPMAVRACACPSLT
jgi:hypothetical protein